MFFLQLICFLKALCFADHILHCIELSHQLRRRQGADSKNTKCIERSKKILEPHFVVNKNVVCREICETLKISCLFLIFTWVFLNGGGKHDSWMLYIETTEIQWKTIDDLLHHPFYGFNDFQTASSTQLWSLNSKATTHTIFSWKGNIWFSWSLINALLSTQIALCNQALHDRIGINSCTMACFCRASLLTHLMRHFKIAIWLQKIHNLGLSKQNSMEY